MRIPDDADGPGGSDGPADGVRGPGEAVEGWRGWAGEVGVVVRRSWRVIAEVLLVTMVLPLLPLSGLIADGATVGAASSSNGKDSGTMLAVGLLVAPALLALAVGCGLVVARGWTAAVWAAASAGSGRPPGLRDALRWSKHRSRRLWARYMIGVAGLVGAALLSGSEAPQASTVPALLALAGPAGLAPVLCFASPVACGGHAPGAGGPPAAGPAVTGAWRCACLAPMAFALAVIVGCEAVAALVLSWLMNPASPGDPSISAPAAALIASLIVLPGSLLLAAASSVSYARCGARPGR